MDVLLVDVVTVQAAPMTLGEGLAGFFAQGFTALGPKLGPIMWQFAHYRRFDADDIAAFIDLLPHELDGIMLRHAIEPRHESFRDEKFFDLCRARNVAVVFEDSDDYPCIDVQTADFAYARLQRMSEDVVTGYDDATLDDPHEATDAMIRAFAEIRGAAGFSAELTPVGTAMAQAGAVV